MSDYTTNATVELNVNGQKAKNVLEEQTQLVNNLRKAWAEAKVSGDKSASSIEKEWKKATRELKSMRAETENVAEVLKRLDKATPKELKQTLRSLEQQLNKIERGSKAWEEHTEKIRRVKKEFESVNNSLKLQQTGWQKMSDWINKWQTLSLGGVAAVSGIIGLGKKAVQAYADMDSAMANTQKFTGMTREQVEFLNDEFKNMDTRTSREGLNELAQSAGRLGKKSVEDVMEFVRAGDIIGVAMDELGAEAPEIISKLAGIFNLEAEMGTEKAMLSAGSAINTLSQNYAASAPALVDFSSRMGATASQTNMAMHEMLAFGTLLDANNVSIEKASTAMQGTISKMYAMPAAFAKKAGLDVNTFTDALKRSSTEGVMMFVDALAHMDQMQLNATLKDLGIAGAGVTQTFQTLAGKSADLKKILAESKDAFDSATSATEEFNVQNNTVQAGLDKAKKRFNELAVELGEKLAPVMKYVISSTTILMKAMSAIFSFIGKYKGELVVLTASIVAYNIAVNAAAVKTKALAVAQAVAKVAMVAWKAITLLSAAATALFTGNVTRATIAFKAFSATLKLSPIGLLVGTITAAVGALVLLSKKTNAVAESQKALNNIRKDASVKLAEEKTKIDLLVSAANNEKLSLDERKNAIDKLNGIIPNYNAQLDETTGKYKANKTALDEYINSLAKKYEIEGAKALLADIGRDTANLNTERAETEKKLDDAKSRPSAIQNTIPKTSGGAVAPISYHEAIANSAEISVLEDKIEDIDHDLDVLVAKRNRILAKYDTDLHKDAATIDDGILTGGGGSGDSGNGDTTFTDDRFKTENDWRERAEALNRIAYAKGEKNYDEYRKRIDEIAVQYYEKLKSHALASHDEQIQLEAQYYDALEKQQKTHNAISLDEENARYNDVVSRIKQNFIDGDIKTTEAYHNTLEMAELIHKERVTWIYKEGSDEHLKAIRDYQDALFANKQKNQKKIEENERKSAEEIKKMRQKYFGLSPEEQQAAADEALRILEIAYKQELSAAEDNSERKLKIEKQYQEARKKILSEFTPETWLDRASNMGPIGSSPFDGLIQIFSEEGQMQKTIQNCVSSVWSAYQSLTDIAIAESEIQIAAIEKRYDKEISLAEGNAYKVNLLEKKKEKEIAKTKNEANKKMFAMQVIQALAQTATNAIAAYGSAAAIPVVGFTLAPIAAGLTVAAGMLQIAAIKKQQQASASQGYASGGFTPQGGKYEPAGIVHKGEWVASQELLASPVARPLIEALDFAQRTNTIGSLRSDDVSRSITAPAVIASANGNNAIADSITSQAVALAYYAGTIKKLNDRLNEPFFTVNTVTGDDGIKKVQDDYDKLLRNKTPKSKRK